MDRRDFLKQSATAAGALGGAMGLAGCTPGRTARAGRNGRVLGANDRIRIGVIGCGGLGMGHHVPKLMKMSEDKKLNMELAAVCDIYEPRKEAARKATGARLFHDYRDMLDGDVVDGVVIVTPDHWHGPMALDAMHAGKDVHVEKPMTLYWEEAKEVYETSQKLGRVVQVGAEGTSRDIFWQANRLIRDGRIGKVVWATAGVYRNVPEGDWNYPIDPNCTPKTLDWERFLGPAPQRPFDPERYFRFRKYWDYSGGLATDLHSHMLSALQTAIGAEFPSRVTGGGGIYCHPDRDVPDTFHIMLEYPSQYVTTLFCTQTTTEGVPMIIRGEKGSISFSNRRHVETSMKVIVKPESAYFENTEPEEIRSEPRMDHDVNFIHCMRTREETHCPPLTGYKVMVGLDLANRSWREGRMYCFDGEKQKVA